MLIRFPDHARYSARYGGHSDRVVSVQTPVYETVLHGTQSSLPGSTGTNVHLKTTTLSGVIKMQGVHDLGQEENGYLSLTFKNLLSR